MKQQAILPRMASCRWVTHICDTKSSDSKLVANWWYIQQPITVTWISTTHQLHRERIGISITIKCELLPILPVGIPSAATSFVLSKGSSPFPQRLPVPIPPYWSKIFPQRMPLLPWTSWGESRKHHSRLKASKSRSTTIAFALSQRWRTTYFWILLDGLLKKMLQALSWTLQWLLWMIPF